MGVVTVRLYEELSDFIPPHMRKMEFEAHIQPGWSVGDLLASIHVPEDKVDLILLNGSAAGRGSCVEEGDRLAIYPMFESMDISTLLPAGEKPLRKPRFAADIHLGKLARYLRGLGFDTLYENSGDPDWLADKPALEERIVLTRNKTLATRARLSHCLVVRAERPAAQLAEVVAGLDLYALARPFSRCMVCNCAVEPVEKEKLVGRVPARTLGCYERFHICPGCGKVYWQGGSYHRLERIFKQILGSD